MILTGDVQEDIKIIKDAALVVYPDNSIMRDLCVCQAILESGVRNGGSVLSNKYNNLFGIKGKGIKTGKSILLPTREYMNGRTIQVKDKFALNDSVEESFLQHRKILTLPRYSLVWKSKDFSTAAVAVKEAGYATDQHYSKLLIDVYNHYVK